MKSIMKRFNLGEGEALKREAFSDRLVLAMLHASIDNIEQQAEKRSLWVLGI